MKRFAISLSFACILLLILPGGQNAGGEDNYAGIDVCKACHPDRFESYIKSVHAKKAIPGVPSNREDCESCHGSGAAHVEKGGGRDTGIFSFKKTIRSHERDARCLACHEQTKSVAFWDISAHKTSGDSCDECHSIHSGLDDGLKEREPYVCFGCHRDIRARFNRQSRHPVTEEKMKCTLCHSPMGSFFGRKMLKADSINELCYTCHAEKRGPFMWEHPPVAENCLNCHTPHGSNHPKLLEKKAPLVCQSCHDERGHPGNIYTRFETFKGPDTVNRMVARSCVNCHTNIHGSNGPSARGSHFLR